MVNVGDRIRFLRPSDAPNGDISSNFVVACVHMDRCFLNLTIGNRCIEHNNSWVVPFDLIRQGFVLINSTNFLVLESKVE